MEVMPVYQTTVFMHNILVGMICLDEIKYYSTGMLWCITLAALCCCLGIKILILKYDEKVDPINFGSQKEKTCKETKLDYCL